MRRKAKLSFAILVCFLVVLISMALARDSHLATAQPEPPGRLNVAVSNTDNTLKGKPVMISALRDGKVINQYEAVFDYGAARTILDKLPAGVYDVRVEGEGLSTDIKRGVQVFAGRDGVLQFVARPGKGVHIVEYATGGLSREEIAARIEKLEATMAQVQKAIQSK